MSSRAFFSASTSASKSVWLTKFLPKSFSLPSRLALARSNSSLAIVMRFSAVLSSLG